MKVFNDLMVFCAKNNAPEFNRSKALEEAAEFMEAVLKYQTKHPENPKRPEKTEMLKEYGDFLYRGFILLIQEFPELTLKELGDAIEKHVEEKLSKLESYKDAGKYTNGL